MKHTAAHEGLVGGLQSSYVIRSQAYLVVGGYRRAGHEHRDHRSDRLAWCRPHPA